jgi:uncharacterized protein (TIGR00730 family)
MHRVCVFAGSKPGTRPPYVAAATSLGKAIAERGWGLVYGGSRAGLMGAVADSALEAGGEVLGVIPQATQRLSREQAHLGLTRLYVVSSMHERKARMHELAGAFVALPGGFGTMDEVFEAITWMQLGLHAKPIAFLDVLEYWQPLARWIERSVVDGFVDADSAAKVCVDADLTRLLDAVAPSGPGGD